MIDKEKCLSSYMAYRYIYKNNLDFFNGFHHENIKIIKNSEKVSVYNEFDIDNFISKEFDNLYKKYNNIGILLSGGMDSAILATYLKPQSHAYTFKSDNLDTFDLDCERASKYCDMLNLNHHFININFDDYKKYTPIVMNYKCAPVHSIEPQIFKAAISAKEDGVDLLIVGESSDLIFGGMDKLLSQDWNYDDFVKRYTFLEPKKVLSKPSDVYDLYENYRTKSNKIDFLKFMDDVFSVESSSSYYNAFKAANMKYFDPYAKMIMGNKLDLNRIRSGESKYLIRALYSLKYPDLEIPEKIPMPRPVDYVFKNWTGPQRKEFRNDIDMNSLTGNQKWQLWCAEKFLDIFEI